MYTDLVVKNMRLNHSLIAIVLVVVLVAVSASGCLTSTNNSTSSGGAVLAAETALGIHSANDVSTREGPAVA